MTLSRKIFANTLFVADPKISKSFYLKVFGVDPVYQDEQSVVFKFGETLINLLAISEAGGLINPVAVATKESGSRSQFTIQVKAVDEEVKKLLEIGVEIVNGPLDRPWGVRTALFADPDGHLWELAEELVNHQ